MTRDSASSYGAQASPLKTLVAYLEAFEQAYTSDNWNLIDPYFTADASYRVDGGPPFSGHWSSLEGIKTQFKTILDEFDRRFDERIPELLGRPKLKEDAILFEWKATYKLAGVPDFVLVGKSAAHMRDGQIYELIDFISPEDCLAGANYLLRWREKLKP